MKFLKASFLLATIFFIPSLTAKEIITEKVTFSSEATILAGTLAYPAKGKVKKAIVFVHGSGPQTRNQKLATAFAKQGIATLVYDKRGVAESGGKYESKQSVSEKNLRLLAADARAALALLNRHPRTKSAKTGLAGISQAGWIVPLAAEDNTEADFIVLWSGPVSKVSEEDIYSKYTADLDQSQVPSFQQAVEARSRPYIWPDFLGEDIDSATYLAKLTVPGLWIFGAQDGSIPVDLSVQKLTSLINKGYDYQYTVVADQGHNNMTQTFSKAVNWINGLPID